MTFLPNSQHVSENQARDLPSSSAHQCWSGQPVLRRGGVESWMRPSGPAPPTHEDAGTVPLPRHTATQPWAPRPSSPGPLLAPSEAPQLRPVSVGRVGFERSSQPALPSSQCRDLPATPCRGIWEDSSRPRTRRHLGPPTVLSQQGRGTGTSKMRSVTS